MARTNIVIDDRLIEQAVSLTGAKSKREAVDIALRRLVEQKRLYRALRGLKGRAAWEGDVSRWRRSRG
jgi:Arc/MetJ family transcription regulator